MNVQHTPGPWHTRKPEESNGYVWINPIDGCCGEIATAWPVKTDAEAEANARLIAAAPDLLDALQALYALPEYDGTKVTSTHRISVKEKVRAALSKATGDRS